MDGEAAFERARTLAGLGRGEEARPLLEEVLARDPDHHGALLLKAGLLAEDRDWTRALEVYERAARLWPASAEALNALARCFHALGRDEEALRWAQAARGILGLGENFRHASAVYLTLVWCLRELRRFREAIAMAEEGLERSPDAILAQWATQVEDDLVEAERDRC